MDEQLYMIRTISEKPFYFKGSGMYAVPKLYQIGSAKRVVRQENKFREGLNNNPRYEKRELVEAVPVTFILGDPVHF